MAAKRILVHLMGGQLTVENIPPGVEVEVRDYDLPIVMEAAGELAAGVDIANAAKGIVAKQQAQQDGQSECVTNILRCQDKDADKVVQESGPQRMIICELLVELSLREKYRHKLSGGELIAGLDQLCNGHCILLSETEREYVLKQISKP